jgi:formyltetrahydrofolate deformylase
MAAGQQAPVSNAADERDAMIGSARLLLSCADQPGIVAAVSSFLFRQGANIIDSVQHSTDPVGGTFFMRLEFALERIEERQAALEHEFTSEVAERFEMGWRLSREGDPKRLAVLVSRHDHCLLDLLWRWRRNDFDADVVQIVSNHPDLESTVREFGLPYAHIPVEKDRKSEAESRLLSLLQGRADLVVLARYMQILSGDFLSRIGIPIINIHHSFLPAFVGPDPYRRAFDRGVKIIGATAHYVTEDLDEGPIIEQDVERVSHRHDAAELEQIGRDIERIVLARAVKWHLEDRVIVHGNKTFVFV